MIYEENVQLRDLCVKIGSGATPRGGKEAYKGGDTSLIRSQNVYNEGFSRDGLVFIDDEQSAHLENVIVERNDVLLNITGDSVARCCQVAEDVLPARVNQHVAIIRPKPNKLDARFLRYLLVSHEYQTQLLALASAGATRPALTKAMIENLNIPTSPLPTQKRIAHILGTLDDKIELNRRMNETLEGMARALFKSWFIDFDPVIDNALRAGNPIPEEFEERAARRRALLDQNQPSPPTPLPGGEGCTGMEPFPNFGKLMPDSFRDSELGPIPEGWEVKTLSEITTLITKGTTPTQSDMSNTSDSALAVNYVRVNSISEDGSIHQDKLLKIPETVHLGVLKRSILKPTDVLYTIAGTIGRICLAEPWILPANTNQAVAIIRPQTEIPSGFLLHAMIQEAFREELHNNIVHAVQANLSLGMLSKARLIMPPSSELLSFYKPIDEILSQIYSNRAQNRTLATLRDTLLPKLLSGALSVEAAEEQMESIL